MPSTPSIINFPASLDDAVSLIEATNNASSTLTAGINASALSVPVADPGEFPSSGIVTLTDSLTVPTKLELVIYTSKSGSNLVVPSGGRGAFGTTAQSWLSGEFIELRPLAQHHLTNAAAIQALEAKLGIGAGAAAANQILRGIGAGASAWGAMLAADLPATLNQTLISVVWASPGAESGNAIEIQASCQDFAGNAFLSGLVDVQIVVSDAANDSSPSATATITAATSPVGSILDGSGTATVVVRTDSSGNFKIKVSETAPGDRYLWLSPGGHSRLYPRSSTGVQQLTFV